jgi:O-antigen ligase
MTGPSSVDRYGLRTLLVIFVVLLAGRFTLGRLGDFPAWDLRWAGVVAIGLLCLAWATVAPGRLPVTGTGALSWFFLAWVGWMVLSVGWTPHGARVTPALVNMGMLAAVIWAAWGVAGRLSPRAVGAVWWWIYVAGWVYFAGAMAAGVDEQGRHSAFGGGPNVFARVMALAVLATLVLTATKRRPWVLVGLPAFFLGAYLSGSRGGLLALLIVLLLGGPKLVGRLGRRARATLALGTIPLAAGATFFYDPAWLEFGQDRFVERTFEQGYDSGRSDILETALRLFDEHLWFGTGLDGFYVLQGGRTLSEYPHNLVVSTAAEGGLVGLALLCGGLVSGVVAIFRRRPMATGTLGFGLAALLLFVTSMFSGDYFDSRFLWFFLGLAVISAGGEDARPAAGPVRTVGPAAWRNSPRAAALRAASSGDRARTVTTAGSPSG